MKKEQTYFDVIVVGTGISGLYTALSLDEKLNVLIISKGKVDNCNTIRAEGGMAASVGKKDSPLLQIYAACRSRVGEVMAENTVR